VWDENSPIAGVNPSYSMKLNRTHAAFDPTDPDFSDDHTRGTRGQFGDGGQLSFTSEVQHFSGQHGAPSIDAIGHIGRTPVRSLPGSGGQQAWVPHERHGDGAAVEQIDDQDVLRKPHAPHTLARAPLRSIHSKPPAAVTRAPRRASGRGATQPS